MMNDRIVLVGGNHHNGLNLARMFGENGMQVDLYCVDSHQKNFPGKSRYVNNTKSFISEKEAFDYIIKKYDSDENVFIFPYSDGAAYELDVRLDEFIPHFICPSINKRQGTIAKMMDKLEQYKFANENKIKMAKTEIAELVSLRFDKYGSFPYILKPYNSAKGSKADIRVVHSEEELKSAVDYLILQGYDSILIQEYINVSSEIDAYGCIFSSKKTSAYSTNRVIRQWPPKTGTGSFHQVVIDKKISKTVDYVLKSIKNLGFSGLIDLELFMDQNGEIYLNEINWRNSGGGV